MIRLVGCLDASSSLLNFGVDWSGDQIISARLSNLPEVSPTVR